MGGGGLGWEPLETPQPAGPALTALCDHCPPSALRGGGAAGAARAEDQGDWELCAL